MVMRTLFVVLLALLCGSLCPADERTVVIGSRLVEISSPLYLAVLDADRRMLRSIEYVVRGEDVAAGEETKRDFYTPTELRDECLESADYTASAFDQGHTRALLLSAGSAHWRDVNCMAVIVPQAHRLNQQTIRNLEAHIADLAKTHGQVRVQVECLFSAGFQGRLPQSDEPCQIPAAFLYRLRIGAIEESYLFPNAGEVESDPQRYRIAD